MRIPLLTAAILVTWIVSAQASRLLKSPPDLGGVYQSIANTTSLPGGLKNLGSPIEIATSAVSSRAMKTVNPKDDPWRKCQPIGQFRMMARERTKVELAPARGMLVMFFDAVAHGLMRSRYYQTLSTEIAEVICRDGE
jgi:hypothetical protein